MHRFVIALPSTMAGVLVQGLGTQNSGVPNFRSSIKHRCYQQQ